MLASDIKNVALVADGMNLGYFDVIKGSPNKVVMTLGNDVDKFFGVHGSFTIKTSFDMSKFTETTVQTIVFPIDGGNQTVTITFKPKVDLTISKSGVPKGTNSGNLNAKQIVWSVDVNKVLDSVYGANLLDTIPAGLTLTNPLDVKVYDLNVKLNGSVTQGSEISNSRYSVTTPSGNLNVAFNESPIIGAYRIQFTTDITDATKTNFTNNASFSGTNLQAVPASATVNVTRGAYLSKKSSDYHSATQVTYWEINYNYNESSVLKDDAVLKDYFDDSQELVKGSVKVFPVNFLTDAAGTVGSTEVSNYTVNPATQPEKNGFELKFNENINSAYQIQYQTKAIKRVEGPETINNSVTSGSTTVPGVRTIDQVIINKSASVNYNSKKVTWTVAINGDSYPMENVVVKDIFTNKGLEIIPETIVVKQGTSTITTGYTIENLVNTTGFNVVFSSPISGPYTISYDTYFDNKRLNYDWLTKDADFVNQATVEWNNPNSTELKTKTVTANFDLVSAESQRL